MRGSQPGFQQGAFELFEIALQSHFSSKATSQCHDVSSLENEWQVTAEHQLIDRLGVQRLHQTSMPDVVTCRRIISPVPSYEVPKNH